MTDLRSSMLKWGEHQPAPPAQRINVGDVSLELHGTHVNHICFAGIEIVRAIYVAVRDRNWGTVQPEVLYQSLDVQYSGAVITLEVAHESPELQFNWVGKLAVEQSGHLRFQMDGKAMVDSLAARIGFCILHPMRFAGLPLRVETTQGPISSAFPTNISPHQPFRDVTGMSYTVDEGVHAQLRMSGETFEMEDQRNWTDASFKTYGPPLGKVVPYTLLKGSAVTQAVELDVRPVQNRHSHERRVATDVTGANVHVGDEPLGELPALGLGCASHERALSSEDINALRRLGLSHVRVELDLDTHGWPPKLEKASTDSAALGVPLEVELVALYDKDFVLGGEALSGLNVARVLAFGRDHVTHRGQLVALRSTLGQKSEQVSFGGGARSHYAQLNRASELPLDIMDVVGYPLCPQVHVIDRLSMMESLAAQGATARAASLLAPECLLTLGPVTLKPRFNSSATGPPIPRGPDSLPEDVDLRQLSLFAATWVLGSIEELSATGVVHSVTYFQTIGPRGIIGSGEDASGLFPAEAGQPFPAYFVFLALAAWKGASVLSVNLSDPNVTQALALRSGSRCTILIGNVAPRRREVSIQLDERSLWGAVVTGSVISDCVTVPGQVPRSAAVRNEGDSGRYSLELNAGDIVQLFVDAP